MKQDFPAIWAESPVTLRREPTNAEVAGGFPCGDLDRTLFNELVYRLAQMYRELSYAIVQSGQTPNANNLTQVWQAMQAAAPDYSFGVASGTGTALTIAAADPPVSVPYKQGAVVYVQMPAGLSLGGNATIALGTGDRVSLQRNNGDPTQLGDAPALTGFFMGFNNGAWQFIQPAAAEVVKIPTANKVLYVRPNGNDANDGSADTDAMAFRTPAAAISYGIRRFSIAGTSLTIQLAASGGTPYPPLGTVPAPAGTLIIRGNPSAKNTVVISGSGTAGNALAIFSSGAVQIDGITFQNTGTISHTIASIGANVSCFNVDLASTANNTTYSHAYSNTFASITFNAGCSGSGNMGAYFEGAQGIVTISAPFSMNGAITVSRATAIATKGGGINLRVSGSVTGSSVTGKRYLASDYGIVDVFGAGPNAFPGTIDGTVDNGTYRP